jgi:hypothetical protein
MARRIPGLGDDGGVTGGDAAPVRVGAGLDLRVGAENGLGPPAVDDLLSGGEVQIVVDAGERSTELGFELGAAVGVERGADRRPSPVDAVPYPVRGVVTSALPIRLIVRVLGVAGRRPTPFCTVPLHRRHSACACAPTDERRLALVRCDPCACVTHSWDHRVAGVPGRRSRAPSPWQVAGRCGRHAKSVCKPPAGRQHDPHQARYWIFTEVPAGVWQRGPR